MRAEKDAPKLVKVSLVLTGKFSDGTKQTLTAPNLRMTGEGSSVSVAVSNSRFEDPSVDIHITRAYLEPFDERGTTHTIRTTKRPGAAKTTPSQLMVENFSNDGT